MSASTSSSSFFAYMSSSTSLPGRSKLLLLLRCFVLLAAAAAAAAGCSGEESPADEGKTIVRDGGVVDPGDADGADAQRPDGSTGPSADAGREKAGDRQPCQENADCASGWCVPYAGAYVCTRPCLDDCEGGWLCREVVNTGSDTVSLCMPPDDRLCLPCLDDTDCAGGLCWTVDPGANNRFCVQPCIDGGCRAGFVCGPLSPDATVSGEFCVPATRTCTCTPENEGMDRLCTASNAEGTCLGREFCVPAEGWVGCDAPQPLRETCNLRDDDCDGVVDDVEGLGLACERAAELADGRHACRGVLRCVEGEPGLHCDAPVPGPEECNYGDDDCDGETDEGFRDPVTGLYATPAHCGMCGYSCEGRVPFAAEMLCVVEDGTPGCRVGSCAPGYYRAGDFACLPVSSHPCAPCRDDSSCAVLGDRCLTLEGQQFCGQDCSPTNLHQLAPGVCPDGYVCTDLGGGIEQCLPQSGSCTCLAAHAENTRRCTSANELGTCTGLEICDPLVGWVSCTAPLPAVESCNGRDDDCNGAVDEGFDDLHQPCSVGEGACRRTGVRDCSADGTGTVCAAAPGEPRGELCNYVDDDCDGLTDEDFRDPVTGLYDRLEHCGVCDNSCSGAILFATSTVCSLDEAVPSCRVEACEPGFVIAGGGHLCIPENGASDCSPCASDLHCVLLEEGRCDDFPDGLFCTRGCTGDEDCLAAYACLDGRCRPRSGSCTCLPYHDGASRTCFRSNEHGTCAGTQICDAQAVPGWSDCDAALPAAEVCDGVDNDCNGLGDEGLAHVEGPVCTVSNAWGSCRGLWVCTGAGGWSCTAAVAAEDLCNGQDDDCDGQIDEDYPELQRPCFAGTGACRVAGVYGCTADGRAAECQAQAGPPAPERCDGVDNDCDGSTDEDFPGLGSACTVGEGACQAEGVIICHADGGSAGCSAVPREPAAERCNGLDDDCDGQIDEDFPGLAQPCFVGEGVCRAVAAARCNEAGDGTVCPAQAGQPAAELCDGLDNDCDGLTDEDFAELYTPCLVGLGICQDTGLVRCAADGLGTACSARPGPALPESCNGLDDDCDGQTDEDFLVGGRIATNEHCGACGHTCVGAIPDGTARCAAELEVPTCVVVDCDPGFVAVGTDQCLSVGLGQCDPCLSDENCLLPGGTCTALPDGSFCLNPCQDGGDCPAGTLCTALGPAGGGRSCLPASGSCVCDGSDLSLQRGCQVDRAPGDGQPGYTCFGVQNCGPDGWSACSLPPESCNGFDDDCDGSTDEDFLDAAGRLATDENCGQCGNDCTLLVYPGSVGVCNAEVDPPRCVASCGGRCFDADDNPGNGCECCDPQPVDLPDVDGVDANCDGIDGERDNAIFVAKHGDDGNDGSYLHPKRTIRAGIAAAAALHKRDVYVATGVYEEAIDLVAGVSVYAGYSANFRVHDILLYEVALLAPEPQAARPAAVHALEVRGGAAGSTVFDGFTIYGYATPPPGWSSYAIYVRDSDATLRMTRNRVHAGNGGRGARGQDGVDGANGAAGGAGQAALDIWEAYGLGAGGCTPQYWSPGGAGGNRVCPDGTVTNGGAGGNRVCPVYQGGAMLPPVASESGSPGAAGGGAGGSAGWDVYHQRFSCMGYDTYGDPEGKAGGDGTDGVDGAAGPACDDPDGRVVDGLWVPQPVPGGQAGTPGTGGGGGGSGAGAWAHNSCNADGYGWHNLGGTGGGGGSGACGGSAGSAGTGGGGAFGLFLAFTAPPASVPALAGNDFYGGLGGRGGDGGNGGTGGAGGPGGLGGAGGGLPEPPTPSYPAFEGGKGGNGGHGGHGGGGGGGCGGPAFAIYVWNAGAANLQPYARDNRFLRAGAGGAGGNGGFSLGSPGAQGLPGAAGDTNF